MTSQCKWPMAKKQKRKEPAYQRPIPVQSYFFFNYYFQLNLACFVSFFYGGVMGCGEQVTNWHYFIQSSFALHSLHFELSRISLSVSLDSLLYYLFLRQSSITVHVQRSTHLLFMISCNTFIVWKASPETLLAELGGSD